MVLASAWVKALPMCCYAKRCNCNELKRIDALESLLLARIFCVSKFGDLIRNSLEKC